MYEFKVEGMTCQGCVRAITKGITQMDPHAEVTVNLSEKEIIIQSTQAISALQTKIEELGYYVLSFS